LAQSELPPVQWELFGLGNLRHASDMGELARRRNLESPNVGERAIRGGGRGLGRGRQKGKNHPSARSNGRGGTYRGKRAGKYEAAARKMNGRFTAGMLSTRKPGKVNSQKA